MAESKWISDLKWARDGQQVRSKKTQAALLDATESLILKHGPDGFSMQDVALCAGSSIGSLYHHFNDKNALFNALFARMITELQALQSAALVPERWAGAGVLDILRGFMSFSLTVNVDRPNTKLAGLLATQSNPEMLRQYSEVQARFYNDLAELLLQRRSEIGHPDPEQAIRLTLDLFGSLIRTWNDPGEQNVLLSERSAQSIVDETAKLAARYLQINES